MSLKEPKKKRVSNRKALVKEFDEVFSRYIRLKNSVDGDATCVTCGVTKPWKELQAGHFYTRGRYPTRWYTPNVHVQCYRCNILLKGNYIPYTKYMIDKMGREVVDDMETLSLLSIKMSSPDMREHINYYKKEVANLLANPPQARLDIDKTPWGVL